MVYTSILPPWTNQKYDTCCISYLWTSYLTRIVKSRITLNVIVFAPYVLEKLFWCFFFYRICKLIYSLEDNKLCFVIPFTVYQSLTFQFHVWNHRGKIYLQNQPKLIKITKYYPGSVLATGSPWQQLISVPLPVVFCPVQTY